MPNSPAFEKFYGRFSFLQPRQISSPDTTDDPIRHEKRLRPAAHLLAEVDRPPGIHSPLWIEKSTVKKGNDDIEYKGRLTNPPMKLYFPKSNTAAFPMYANDPR